MEGFHGAMCGATDDDVSAHHLPDTLESLKPIFFHRDAPLLYAIEIRLTSYQINN
jgi:hypothetical protein